MQASHRYWTLYSRTQHQNLHSSQPMGVPAGQDGFPHLGDKAGKVSAPRGSVPGRPVCFHNLSLSLYPPACSHRTQLPHPTTQREPSDADVGAWQRAPEVHPRQHGAPTRRRVATSRATRSHAHTRVSVKHDDLEISFLGTEAASDSASHQQNHSRQNTASQRRPQKRPILPSENHDCIPGKCQHLLPASLSDC